MGLTGIPKPKHLFSSRIPFYLWWTIPIYAIQFKFTSDFKQFRTSNEFVLWKIIKTRVHLIESFRTESLSDYQIKQIRPKKIPEVQRVGSPNLLTFILFLYSTEIINSELVLRTMFGEHLSVYQKQQHQSKLGNSLWSVKSEHDN